MAAATRAGFAVALLLVGPGAARAEPRRADRPAAAPVRACPDGGFALAGSAACVRLSGTLEAQATVRSGPAHGNGTVSVRHSLFAERLQGRFAADVRVPTELGPVRIYTSIRARPDMPRP